MQQDDLESSSESKHNWKLYIAEYDDSTEEVEIAIEERLLVILINASSPELI